jgi:hypothetical protein
MGQSENSRCVKDFEDFITPPGWRRVIQRSAMFVANWLSRAARAISLRFPSDEERYLRYVFGESTEAERRFHCSIRRDWLLSSEFENDQTVRLDEAGIEVGALGGESLVNSGIDRIDLVVRR